MKNALAKLIGMTVQKATSFEPQEIKGIKSDVKLSIDGQNVVDGTVTCNFSKCTGISQE